MKKIFYRALDYLRHTDISLYLLCMGASALSVMALLAMAYSGHVEYKTVAVQAGASGAGVFVAFLLSKVDYHIMAKLWKLHLPLCIGLVLLTFLIGEGVGEADDVAWLSLPFGLTLQPTEVLKISFIITFAYHLSHVGEELNRFSQVLLLGMHAGSLILLVHLQGDDGTALIFVFIFLSMMFVAGWSWKYLACGAVLTAAAAPLVWLYVMNDDQRGRILALYNFIPDTDNFMYQQNRGLIAIGSGQTLGLGLFSGEHSYIPAMRNDFIFSFIGEALGFVGSLTVILLLCGICIRFIWTSHLALDDLGRLICVGVFAMLAFQSIINIGMNLSLLPVIGVTLPFFSAGGTSMVANYLGIGVVLSVYMHSRRNLFLDK